MISFLMVQMDQHIVTKIFMKNGNLSCALKLSIMAPVSKLLGTWIGRVDQQAREKGHSNSKWATSSSIFKLQCTQLYSGRCMWCLQSIVLVLKRSWSTSQKNFLLFWQEDCHNHLKALWRTCLWPMSFLCTCKHYFAKRDLWVFVALLVCIGACDGKLCFGRVGEQIQLTWLGKLLGANKIWLELNVPSIPCKSKFPAHARCMDNDACS